MQTSITRCLKALFAICLFVGGVYWFVVSLIGWKQEGFIVFTDGEQGKTAISGLLFSLTFMLYGAMELIKLMYDYESKG